MIAAANTLCVQSGFDANKSLGEFFRVVFAIAEHAGSRYRSLAAVLTRCRNELAAESFLAAAEYEDAVLERVRAAARASGCPCPQSADDACKCDWVLPEAAIAEAGGPWLITRHGALAIAVRKEEQVFWFLTEVAAATTDHMVRDWAERLAKETLDRQTTLRLERRRAHRVEYRAPPQARTPRQFQRLALAIEAEAERDAMALARKLRVVDDDSDAALLEKIACDAAANVSDLGGGEFHDLTTLTQAWRFHEFGTVSHSRDAVAVLVKALRHLEERFRIYNTLARAATDEETGHRSRILAEQSVRHLSAIGECLEARQAS